MGRRLGIDFAPMEVGAQVMVRKHSTSAGSAPLCAYYKLAPDQLKDVLGLSRSQMTRGRFGSFPKWGDPNIL